MLHGHALGRAAIGLACFTALLLAAQDACAKLVVRTSTRSEMVWGRTEKELTESIVDHVFTTAVNSPAAAAMCGAMPELKFDIEQKGSQFRLKSWRVKLTIVYYYPKWGNRTYAPKSLQRKWDEYLKVLRKHEETHGEIAKDYAKEIDTALRHVQPASRRGTIENEVRMTFNDLWNKQRKAQEQFDANSNPVRFPLPPGFQPEKQ